MYSASPFQPAARGQMIAGAYRQVAAQTMVSGATPHKLVSLLFDGFVAAANQARGAVRERNVQAKSKAIGSATRIVEEGLRGALNLQGGGALAADLNELYAYIGKRLMQANLRNDEAAIDECLRLIRPLRDAWSAIGPTVESRPVHN